MSLLRKLRATFGPKYASRFGGLWTDRLDALEELDRRVSRGKLTKKDADDVEHFIREGYVVLKGAARSEDADELVRDIEDAWAHGSDRFRVDILGAVHPLRPEHRSQPFKLLDLYVSSDAARRISFSLPIARFLRLVFEEDALAFQSLTFERGTQQAIHQDTAYVVVSEPMRLAASWVALEDVSPGTGELEYYAGSHRLPDYVFGGRFKHWSPSRDGNPAHDAFLLHLHAESQRRGLPRLRFQPKKGDALIWSADLAHGGSEIEDATKTRKSHVTHYCPRSTKPSYFEFAKTQRTVLRHPPLGAYSSMYYPLRG